MPGRCSRYRGSSGNVCHRTFLTNGATDYSLAIGGTVAVLANPPTVTTTTASGITTTGASSGGNVTDDGGASVSAKVLLMEPAAVPLLQDLLQRMEMEPILHQHTFRPFSQYQILLQGICHQHARNILWF